MDHDALAALVRTHQAAVYRYVRYLGANGTDAEDLAQETFLAALRSTEPPDMSDVRSMGAWLRGVARNLFLRHCRKARSAPMQVSSQFLVNAESTWTSEFLHQGDGVDYVEALRRCLGELPARQRRALDLRYAEKSSRAEMARLLEMTENGVKSLLRRIRAALADCVRRRLDLEEA